MSIKSEKNRKSYRKCSNNFAADCTSPFQSVPNTLNRIQVLWLSWRLHAQNCLLRMKCIYYVSPMRSRIIILQHKSITYCSGIKAHISIKDVLSIGVTIHPSTRKDMEIFASTQRDTTPNADIAWSVCISFTTCDGWKRFPGSLQIKIRLLSLWRLILNSSVKRTELHCSRFQWTCWCDLYKHPRLWSDVSGTQMDGCLMKPL